MTKGVYHHKLLKVAMSGGVRVVTPKKIGKFSIRGNIGEGAFSVVNLVYCEESQQYFACKIVPRSRLSSGNLQERFEYEIRISQQLHHPGIVGLIDILKDENNFYVVMEFCPNGELFQHIVDNGKLKEHEAKQKIKEILETLQYIHRFGICHRDLKPENILIDQCGKLKISDFGLSRFADKDGLASTPCGSPCYASPECISGHPYNAQTTDIWSAGVILYAMVTGQLPWTKRNQSQLFEQIRKGEYTIPSYLSPECASFIEGLLTVDINKRLTIEKAFRHPFLSSVQATESENQYLAPCISLKRVDEFFGKDSDLFRGGGRIRIKRFRSFTSKSFDDTFDEITETQTIPVKVRHRLVKVKEGAHQDSENKHKEHSKKSSKSKGSKLQK